MIYKKYELPPPENYITDGSCPLFFVPAYGAFCCIVKEVLSIEREKVALRFEMSVIP